MCFVVLFGFSRIYLCNEVLREELFFFVLGVWVVLDCPLDQDKPAANLQKRFRREGGEDTGPDWRVRALEFLRKEEDPDRQDDKVPKLHRLASYKWLCCLDNLQYPKIFLVGLNAVRSICVFEQRSRLRASSLRTGEMILTL